MRRINTRRSGIDKSLKDQKLQRMSGAQRHCDLTDRRHRIESWRGLSLARLI